MTPSRLGMRLRRIRRARGLTQAALARKAKISREYVNMLEAGRYDPTVSVVQRLAKALGVSVIALLE